MLTMKAVVAAVLVGLALLPALATEPAQAQRPVEPLAPLEVGSLAAVDSTVTVHGGKALQAICTLGTAILQAPFAARDSSPMTVGDVRTAVFTMTATASGVPLGTSTQTLAWSATPYDSGDSPLNLLTITTPTEPWQLIQVDLEAILYDGSAQPMASQKDTSFVIAPPASIGCLSSCPPVCIPPCSDKLTQNAAVEKRIGDYYTCNTGQSLPMTPVVMALPTIDATLPAAPTVCTGKHQTVATGTVGGTVGGGAVIKAEVSVSATVAVLEQYDFACDYGMFAQAYGYGGILRNVRMEKDNPSFELLFGPDGPKGEPIPGQCQYAGLQPLDTDCMTRAFPVLKDAFSGVGIAGPAGGGTAAWPLPTQVRICPPPGWSMTAIGEPWVGIPLYEVTDSKPWVCQNFAIHYL
jgi:hypothetical protein